MVALLAQSTWSMPAFTTGAAVKEIITWSVAARQLPLPVVVSVSVTLPLAISPGVGMYTAPMLVGPGSKLPAPPLHTAPVATEKDPFSWAAELLAHTTMSDPALAVGAGVKV